jgi:hypothetical protein
VNAWPAVVCERYFIVNCLSTDVIRWFFTSAFHSKSDSDVDFEGLRASLPERFANAQAVFDFQRFDHDRQELSVKKTLAKLLLCIFNIESCLVYSATATRLLTF